MSDSEEWVAMPKAELSAIKHQLKAQRNELKQLRQEAAQSNTRNAEASSSASRVASALAEKYGLEVTWHDVEPETGEGNADDDKDSGDDRKKVYEPRAGGAGEEEKADGGAATTVRQQEANGQSSSKGDQQRKGEGKKDNMKRTPKDGSNDDSVATSGGSKRTASLEPESESATEVPLKKRKRTLPTLVEEVDGESTIESKKEVPLKKRKRKLPPLVEEVDTQLTIESKKEVPPKQPKQKPKTGRQLKEVEDKTGSLVQWTLEEGCNTITLDKAKIKKEIATHIGMQPTLRNLRSLWKPEDHETLTNLAKNVASCILIENLDDLATDETFGAVYLTGAIIPIPGERSETEYVNSMPEPLRSALLCVSDVLLKGVVTDEGDRLTLLRKVVLTAMVYLNDMRLGHPVYTLLD